MEPTPRILVGAPIARILDHEHAYTTCVSMAEERDGWRLYHSTAFRRRLYPNHAGDFRAPEGSGDAIAREIIAFYTRAGSTPAAFVDCLATPRDLPARLLRAGFSEWSGADSDLMLYIGPDTAYAADAAIVAAATPTEQDAWASVVEEDAEGSDRETLSRLYRAEIADPRMTAYLICDGGVPVARCELFSDGGLGRVEAVRTALTARRRGYAAALIRRAVADSLARGNELTYLYAEPGGAPQQLYERLGFRTVTRNLIRGFVKW
jgi:GNAT superfamily N-acetyltransferase